MRALFVTRKFLGDGEEPVTGTYKRMGLFLEALSRMATHLDLAVFVPADQDISATAVAPFHAGYARWVRCPFTLHLIPRQPARKGRAWSLYGSPFYAAASGDAQIGAVAALLAQRPELVFIHRLSAMAPLLRGGLRHPNLFFDLDDVEHRAAFRHVSAPPRYPSKYLGLLRVPALMRAERQAVGMARKSYVCSATDRDYLARLYRTGSVQVIPNAVTIPGMTALPADPVLMFLGSANFSPNQVGADWLAREVWPRIRAAIPEARLVLAGEFPERLAAFAAKADGIGFPGFVADLDALYAGSRVVACPILSGSGTRFKIIEAAAYGRPVVSTRIGAEGLDLADGTEILLRDSPADFAAACIGLLRDDAAAARLGLAARQAAIRVYDRDQVIRRIQDSIAGA